MAKGNGPPKMRHHLVRIDRRTASEREEWGEGASPRLATRRSERDVRFVTRHVANSPLGRSEATPDVGGGYVVFNSASQSATRSQGMA
jgi:hypothetical protein